MLIDIAMLLLVSCLLSAPSSSESLLILSVLYAVALFALALIVPNCLLALHSPIRYNIGPIHLIFSLSSASLVVMFQLPAC